MNPDVEVDEGLGFASRRVLAADRPLVNEGLGDTGEDHGDRSANESGKDLLNRGKVDTGAAEGRVDKEIEDRDEDDQCEGVQVVEDIVGETVSVEEGSLRSQVVVDFYADHSRLEPGKTTRAEWEKTHGCR